MCVISCAKHETNPKVSLHFEVAVRQELRPVSKTCVSMVLIDVYKEPIDSHESHFIYRGQFVRLLHETLHSSGVFERTIRENALILNLNVLIYAKNFTRWIYLETANYLV